MLRAVIREALARADTFNLHSKKRPCLPQAIKVTTHLAHCFVQASYREFRIGVYWLLAHKHALAGGYKASSEMNCYYSSLSFQKAVSRICGYSLDEFRPEHPDVKDDLTRKLLVKTVLTAPDSAECSTQSNYGHGSEWRLTEEAANSFQHAIIDWDLILDPELYALKRRQIEVYDPFFSVDEIGNEVDVAISRELAAVEFALLPPDEEFRSSHWPRSAKATARDLFLDHSGPYLSSKACVSLYDSLLPAKYYDAIKRGISDIASFTCPAPTIDYIRGLFQ